MQILYRLCQQKTTNLACDGEPIPDEFLNDPILLKIENESISSNNSTQNANSVADEIAKLVKLKDSGALTDDEFTKMKNELIDKM